MREDPTKAKASLMREVSKSKNRASRSNDRLGARRKDVGGGGTDEDTDIGIEGNVNCGFLFS